MSVTLTPTSLYPVTPGLSAVPPGSAGSTFSGVGAASTAPPAAGGQSAGTLQPLSSQIQALLVQLQVGSQAPGANPVDGTPISGTGARDSASAAQTARRHHEFWHNVPPGPGLAANPTGPATAAGSGAA